MTNSRVLLRFRKFHFDYAAGAEDARCINVARTEMRSADSVHEDAPYTFP